MRYYLNLHDIICIYKTYKDPNIFLTKLLQNLNKYMF